MNNGGRLPFDFGDRVPDLEINDPFLEKFIEFISSHKGIDLSLYRKTFVLRRLRIRMGVMKTPDLQRYLLAIKSDPNEFNELLNTLGVNVTEFFRDQEVFTFFKEKVLAELVERKLSCNQRIIRIWSAACATGEEAYSIAITVKEALRGKNDFSVKIMASDMDKEALGKAQKAEYKANELRKLDKKILDNYFIPVYNNLYHLREDIRQMVSFHQRNLFTDEFPNFNDVIFCRNMMIYLAREQQDRLIRRFYEVMTRKGYLVIGKVENIWEKNLFSVVDSREKIYQKVV